MIANFVVNLIIGKYFPGYPAELDLILGIK